MASSFLRLLHHTQRHIIVGRTPLDEWSARRRDLYLHNAQHSQQTNIHAPCGNRTHDLSRRAAVDLRLRSRSHWDRLHGLLPVEIYIFCSITHRTSVRQKTNRISSFLITRCEVNALRPKVCLNTLHRYRNVTITKIIIIINIKDWTLWPVPSPQLQLLAPTLLLSANCSPSLWSVVVWFQRN